MGGGWMGGGIAGDLGMQGSGVPRAPCPAACAAAPPEAAGRAVKAHGTGGAAVGATRRAVCLPVDGEALVVGAGGEGAGLADLAARGAWRAAAWGRGGGWAGAHTCTCLRPAPTPPDPKQLPAIPPPTAPPPTWLGRDHVGGAWAARVVLDHRCGVRRGGARGRDARARAIPVRLCALSASRDAALEVGGRSRGGAAVGGARHRVDNVISQGHDAGALGEVRSVQAQVCEGLHVRLEACGARGVQQGEAGG